MYKVPVSTTDNIFRVIIINTVIVWYIGGSKNHNTIVNFEYAVFITQSFYIA